jgi:hypothetical protein
MPRTDRRRPVTPPPTASRRLADRIAAIQQELLALRQQQRDEADGRLLRALVIGTRGCVFTTADVYTRAVLDPDVAAAVGDLSPRQLGKRLARVVGRTVSGLTVRRVLATKDGWVWEIDYHRDAGAGR